MSTLNIGKTCAECLQDGRCLPTCYTQGGGWYIATGLTRHEARTIVVATRAMPANTPAVAVVSCGGPQNIITVFSTDVARHLAKFIADKADEAER